MLKLLICILNIFFKAFLQDALRKKQESGEFIEIGTNDILSQALGIPQNILAVFELEVMMLELENFPQSHKGV